MAAGAGCYDPVAVHCESAEKALGLIGGADLGHGQHNIVNWVSIRKVVAAVNSFKAVPAYSLDLLFQTVAAFGGKRPEVGERALIVVLVRFHYYVVAKDGDSIIVSDSSSLSTSTKVTQDLK